jgi:hypothetical protein
MCHHFWFTACFHECDGLRSMKMEGVELFWMKKAGEKNAGGAAACCLLAAVSDKTGVGWHRS